MIVSDPKPQRPMTSVRIEIETIELTHAQVWPDWDGEAVLTAADVAELIASEGGLASTIDAWNLHPGATVEVIIERENPAYAGDDVLFGEAPPRMLVTRTTARVKS